MELTLNNSWENLGPLLLIFNCLIIWLSVSLSTISHQIIIVHNQPIYMFIIIWIFYLFSVWVSHYLMFLLFWNPLGCVQSTTKSQCDWVSQGFFRWTYNATPTLLECLGIIYVAFFMDCWSMPLMCFLMCSENKWYDVGYLSFFPYPKCSRSSQPDQQQGDIHFLNLDFNTLF